MPYDTRFQVVFDAPVSQVYAALIDLSQAPIWNSGMKVISHKGKMTEGLVYSYKSVVLGQENVWQAKVVKLVPNKEIRVDSLSGVIGFSGFYKLAPKGKNRTVVELSLRFELRGMALNLARPVIQSMAQARLQGDLETLKAMLAEG